MATSTDVAATRSVLDWVGAQMGVSFNLRQGSGDVLLVDGELQSRLAPQLIHALREERPLVTLPRTLGADNRGAPPVAHDPLTAMALLEQFRAIPVLAARRQAAAPSGATFHAGWPALVRLVLMGRDTPSAPSLWASYGPMACMHFDFRSRQVLCDPLALQHLRLHRDLPKQLPPLSLQPDAVPRSLAATMWDLGIAAGPLPLLDAPADCWLAPLSCEAGVGFQEHTRCPMHLDALRLLQVHALSPTQLQRRLRTGMTELRQLLQAALWVGWVRWTAVAARPRSATANP